ncbi:MAG TPA: hypothetical protein VHG08_27805 [Longimicrobium sp.]|nr:hypothetical protein [Longimicrobium sp.]
MKLRLNTDDLRVEPFEVESRESEAGGTVHANDFSGPNCPTHPGYSCGYPAPAAAPAATWAIRSANSAPGGAPRKRHGTALPEADTAVLLERLKTL